LLVIRDAAYGIRAGGGCFGALLLMSWLLLKWGLWLGLAEMCMCWWMLRGPAWLIARAVGAYRGRPVHWPVRRWAYLWW
jgi:hypothetical protein